MVLDVGTTGVKAILFDHKFKIQKRIYQSLSKVASSRGGRVEQDPEELLDVSVQSLKELIAGSRIDLRNCGLGIANQRETTILWDKITGRPVYPAIVWEDARTRRYCRDISVRYGRLIRSKTGLDVLPYFSASKIRWILDNVKDVDKLLKQGRLIFGTVDSWLLWNLLEDRKHITDQTNASRTLLFDIKKLAWDKSLLDIFGIPEQILPRVLPSSSFFGRTRSDIFGKSVPILAVCGDQQSSMYAVGTNRAATKITYGTGTFVMQIMGSKFAVKKGFFTTLVPAGKKPVLAFEGKINGYAKQVEPLLKKPVSLNRLVSKIAREVAIMVRRLPIKPKLIVVDGGVTQNDFLIKRQSAETGLPIIRQDIYEGTALGLAKLMHNPRRT